MAKYPDDWVEVKGPPSFVQPLRDGTHYTTNAQGKVGVRPYHVQEMIGRGYTATDSDMETIIGEQLTRLPFITPADVADNIAKAATKKARDAAASASGTASAPGDSKATPARA